MRTVEGEAPVMKDKPTRRTFTIAIIAGALALMTIAKAEVGPPLTNSPSEAKVLEVRKLLAGKAINPFALKMYATIERGDKNFVFSPLSIFTGLAIAYEGARGQTRDEISKVLGLEAAGVPLDTTLGGLALELVDSARRNGGGLNWANCIWTEIFPDHAIREAFRQTVKQEYQGDIREANLRASPDKVAKEMNEWVSEKTGGKITDLISADQLQREKAVLSIVNALYFKNIWAWPFEGAKTRHADFICTNGSRVKVPMMHSSKDFPYMEEEDFQAIAMPYEGWKMSMVVFLPKRVDGLKEFERSLTPENLRAWLAKLATWRHGLKTSVPKFTSRFRYSLKPELQSMGMHAAFNSRIADFSGMFEAKRLNAPKIGLFVTSVLHETWIDVNEKGTEAAAATDINKAKLKGPAEPRPFCADHPFMFIIRHNITGCILFMGRVTNPLAIN